MDGHLGVSPWTVLAQGLGKHLGVDVGVGTFLISAAVLLLWIPLREKPGLGTLANAVIIALALGITAHLLPSPSPVGWQLAEVFGGTAAIGIGSGLYLTTGLGPGPRDGLMTGLHHRTGLPVTVVRLAIEVVALAAGWALGGKVGLGTAIFALLIGPAVGYGLLIVGRLNPPAVRPLTKS